MIPLAARVAALADVFDALTHRRCYKLAWSVDDALREIGRLRGRHFDPELTDLFLQLVPDLRARHRDLDAYLGAEARKNDFIKDRTQVARDLKTRLGTFDLRR
jgi:putative two-component system response regulator